ncbi:MAG: protein translocase subunit SecF [Clostridia bacterium]|nr:protein translocase subunit SecF [Clostridia bacterium]
MKTPTSKSKFFFILSAICVVLSIVLLFVNGLNYGIDFTGGTTLQFDMGKKIDNIEDIEKEVTQIIKTHVKTKDVTVQQSGDDEISIRTVELSNKQGDKIIEDIKAKYNLEQKNLLVNEKVSGSVSGRLIVDSLKAVALAIILMLIYITFRFDFQSGTSAVLALAHDVIIMLGFYALFQFTVSTSFIAAILTIVGYSINATIIVFDRVRENARTMKQATPNKIADEAITSSYFRAINSSITTLLTIGVLYVMGVDSIKEFALPIIVGIVAGTYSSLFIAGPFWAWWKGGDKKAR